MKIFICLLVVSISFQAFAEPAFLNPIQDLEQQAVDFLQPIELVKVKVFPHDGPYSNPQGAESRMDQAVIKSTGSCSLISTSGTQQGSTFTVKAQDFLKGPGSLNCDSTMTLVREGAVALSYRGSFSLHHKNGKLVIVNVVPFNDYLKGVVPAEMAPSWPLESLKAQAIAARTYAANQILQARSDDSKGIFEVDDTVMYQAYRGLTVERPTTSEAVEATDEIYLMDSKGRPIIAYFSADSGGYTESAENVWGGRGLSYTPSKPEVYDLRLIKSAWSAAVTLAEIEKKLVDRGVVPKDFKLAQFDVIEWTVSGRMKMLKLVAENGDVLELTGAKFRYGMAFRSSLLKFSETTKNTFQFDGLGYGHGVGMNQTGAKVLAESLGWDYSQILSFYYEGITPRSFSPRSL